MTPNEIAELLGELGRFVEEFSDCFCRSEHHEKMLVYIRGQLSQMDRKSAEPMAIEANISPRSLQEFLGTDKWDEDKFGSLVGQAVPDIGRRQCVSAFRCDNNSTSRQQRSSASVRLPAAFTLTMSSLFNQLIARSDAKRVVWYETAFEPPAQSGNPTSVASTDQSARQDRRRSPRRRADDSQLQRPVQLGNVAAR